MQTRNGAFGWGNDHNCSDSRSSVLFNVTKSRFQGQERGPVKKLVRECTRVKGGGGGVGGGGRASTWSARLAARWLAVSQEPAVGGLRGGAPFTCPPAWQYLTHPLFPLHPQGTAARRSPAGPLPYYIK